MQKKAATIIGHGSRKKISNELLVDLAKEYQERRQDIAINYGFIELAEPHMSDSLTKIAHDADSITALPLQLFRGNHIKRDIPEAINTAKSIHPQKRFLCADALGTHPLIIELAYLRAKETTIYAMHPENEISVILVGRGSEEEDSISDFKKVFDTFKKSYNFKTVTTAFIAINEPPLEASLKIASKEQHDKLIILPYFLLTGILLDRIHSICTQFASENPSVKLAVAEALGAHPNLFRALDEQLENAV